MKLSESLLELAKWNYAELSDDAFNLTEDERIAAQHMARVDTARWMNVDIGLMIEIGFGAGDMIRAFKCLFEAEYQKDIEFLKELDVPDPEMRIHCFYRDPSENGWAFVSQERYDEMNSFDDTY